VRPKRVRRYADDPELRIELDQSSPAQFLQVRLHFGLGSVQLVGKREYACLYDARHAPA
jgi:hypothetical protein